MKSHDSGVTRRCFIGTVGSSCAVLSLAGLTAGDSRAQETHAVPRPRRRASTKVVSEGEMMQVSTDVLVVGGGMAGVFAAVKAHDRGAKVILVDKGTVGKSGQTPFARGIFRFDEEQTGMSKTEYLDRTAEASEWMNNPVYTELLLDHSAGPHRKVAGLGVSASPSGKTNCLFACLEPGKWVVLLQEV